MARKKEENVPVLEAPSAGELDVLHVLWEEKLKAGQALQLSELASNPGGKEALLQAITLLDEALARDPHFFSAYGLLSAAHIDISQQFGEQLKSAPHTLIRDAARAARKPLSS